MTVLMMYACEVVRIAKLHVVYLLETSLETSVMVCVTMAYSTMDSAHLV